jgi:hypothetical protein
LSGSGPAGGLHLRRRDLLRRGVQATAIAGGFALGPGSAGHAVTAGDGFPAVDGHPFARTHTSVTVREGTNFYAAVSPCGRYIALDLLGTLWVLPAAGGEARALTDRITDVAQPHWSPDSRRLAFQAYHGDHSDG